MMDDDIIIRQVHVNDQLMEMPAHPMKGCLQFT